MSDQPDHAVYRSVHPDVLTAWENHQRERADWAERWNTQVRAWGFDPEVNKPYVTDGVWGASRLLGIYWGYRRDDPPPGWKRLTSQRHVLEPYASKPKMIPQIRDEYRQLVTVPDLRRDLVPLGMPQHMFTGLAVTTYAATRSGDEVWVKWRRVDPQASDQWWTKVKLSDYYALVETGADPFAKPEPEGAEA